MDIFTSDKNHSVLKSLIEKSINEKLSINIYNNINENVVKNYIKKKIRIFHSNLFANITISHIFLYCIE